MTQAEGGTEIRVAQRIRASRAVQIILVLMLAAWLFSRWLDSIGGPEVVREELGWVAPAVILPLQALGGFTLFAGDAIAIANGLLYGLWLGSLLSWTGWMLTAYLQYFLVRRSVHDLGLAPRSEGLPGWLERFPLDHPAFLILSRIPLGGTVANTAAGALGVPLWRHSWCSAVGTLPRAFFFAAIGTGLLQL